MKDKIFGVLQRVGRSFMLPIALLPAAGLLLGIGGSFTNETMLRTYGLLKIMGPGTVIYNILLVFADAGQIVFDNLPILFAMGVAIGMARKEKEVAALAAVISFFVMHAAISAMIAVNAGHIVLPDGAVSDVVGITSLQMGVFGGIIVGLGVSYLHNRFYKIELPPVLSFFGGTRFVPIICSLCFALLGIVFYFIWPPVQNVITDIGNLVLGSGYVGTWIYGFTERALIPFGLHHVFYIPFWQTAVGGTMYVAGNLVEGAQNIFFAQLADPSVSHFSVEATRFMAGKFPLMIFGLPGAALAMYTVADKDKKDKVSGLLLSAALTSMLTGITEPLEFTFLFVAPVLYVVHCVFAGLSYMLMHILNVGVGMTFSGGLIDLFLFGILQGNKKTGWISIIIVGVIYFLVYYFVFALLIRKLKLNTPGRGDRDEVKLYTREDMTEKRTDKPGKIPALICRGLGGAYNITDVDCCATRLRCTVKDSGLVMEEILKDSGASGVIKSGNGVQIIYGPRVTVIKSELDDYLQGEAEKTKETEVTKEEYIIKSPVKGLCDYLTNTPDRAFAGGMLGEGIVMYPADTCIVAPFDATVIMTADTGHAIGILGDNGIELLIHIGIDTVKLNGRGFNVLVGENERIKEGQRLIEFDRNHIRANAVSDATPVIVTNMQENWGIKVLKTGMVDVLEDIFEIEV